MWFNSWESVARIVVTAALGYVALIVLLRITGKRTLSKWNAFDFVITIALGSVFATLVVSDALPLVEGMVALAMLIGLQWVVSSIYVRSDRFEAVVKGVPEIVFWKGDYLPEVLLRVRITREEIKAAMRDSSIVDERDAAAVLETDGSLTVISLGETDSPHALTGVHAPDSLPLDTKGRDS